MTEDAVSIPSLWSEQWEPAFDQGAAADLVRRRNPALGHLLNSERAGYYIQILYRLLQFRRAHELEPLHDDIYAAVSTAQTAIAQGTAYTDDVFNQDMRQLLEWKVVEERMERERLRGYRAIGYARGEAPLGFAPPPEDLTIEYDEEARHHFDDDE